MNKKKHGFVDWRHFKNFTHYPFNRWCVALSIVLGLMVYLYFQCIPNIEVFPGNKDFSFAFYNDSANGGNSIFTKSAISDRSIVWEYELREGFLSPYVGINVKPENGKNLDLSHYNRMNIEIEGERTENIGIAMFTPNVLKKYSGGTNELCCNTIIEISVQRHNYPIDLDLLRIPDWCTSVNNLSPNEAMNPDLSHILNLNIGTAFTPMQATNGSVRIYSISFERNNNLLLLYLLTGELFLIVFLLVIHYVRATSKREPVSVTISYQPVEIEKEKPQPDSFLEYINTHFNESELTLDQITDHTGFNQRRIANYIQQSFGCNFKTYVNQLRINESRRLLKESDFNMGEIAFRVGFGTQSHFNRVFKSSVGISPSEFRDAGKQ